MPSKRKSQKSLEKSISALGEFFGAGQRHGDTLHDNETECRERMKKYSVEQLLCQARATLAPRLLPTQAYKEMRDGATLVDIRHLEQRMRHGDIPGAVLINRNEFEWRCDPSTQLRNARIAPHDYDQRVIVLCYQGYQSSFAAANLQYIGMKNVTDVTGGFEAWRAAGLPIVPYENTSLDSPLSMTGTLHCPGYCPGYCT